MKEYTVTEKQCYKCEGWQYNERIERTYGMGTGLCAIDREPKGCNRKACLLFREKENREES